MSQLQKKSFVASAMGHFILLAVLIAAPTFLVARYESAGLSKGNPNDPTITVLPSEQVEKALRESSRSSPAPPSPLPQPSSVVSQRPARLSPKLPQIDPVLRTRAEKQPSIPRNDPADAAENFRKQVETTSDVIRKRVGSGSATETIISGVNSSYDYRQAVKAAYDGAWLVPDDVADEDATVKVSVTISRTGTVVSSEILKRSGTPSLDASIAGLLDRVQTIGRPFPDGDQEAQRTFTINFNLRSKRPL